MSILLLQGPLFSTLFWDTVKQRLEQHNLSSHTINWIEQAGAMEKLLPLLEDTVRNHDCLTVVAHGLAVPLALELKRLQPHIKLILSNGPVDSHTLLPWLSLLPKILLRPQIALPFLSSSAAFRRFVINPYVMDHDTIASLSASVLQQTRCRTHIIEYFQDLKKWSRPKGLTGQDISLIWGTSDFLFPIPTHATTFANAPISIIEGGAHFHPIERPWALADQIQKQTVTSMS